MPVKTRVLELLQSKDWVSCEDFERLFPPKTEGHLSWGQRMRELRAEGCRIDKRLKIGCSHTWEYSLITEKPASIFTEKSGQMAFIGDR